MSAYERNLGETERIISIAVGTLLGLDGLRRAPVATALAVAGATLMLRGLTGYCPIAERLTGPSARKRRVDTCIDTTIDESFPASDPPAWAGGR